MLPAFFSRRLEGSNKTTTGCGSRGKNKHGADVAQEQQRRQQRLAGQEHRGHAAPSRPPCRLSNTISNP